MSDMWISVNRETDMLEPNDDYDEFPVSVCGITDSMGFEVEGMGFADDGAGGVKITFTDFDFNEDDPEYESFVDYIGVRDLEKLQEVIGMYLAIKNNGKELCMIAESGKHWNYHVTDGE